MEIGIIILCLILSAFFSGMEIAFVSSNKIYLEIEKKQDNFISKILIKLTEKPSKFIASMLVGISLAALFANIEIPQWLLNLALGIGVAFIVNVFMSLMLTFMALNYRSQHLFVPKYDAEKFIESVEKY